MTSHDQEVILVCKPPQTTVLSSQSTGITSTAPIQARVSGVVEEAQNSKLEYQVEIYRYAEDFNQVEVQSLNNGGGIIINPSVTLSRPYIVPLDEPVPIGTRLQLRAKLDTDGVWKHAKLMEVTISPDPQHSHAEGHVQMLHMGCRTPEMRSLMKNQASRSPLRSSEVWLDFEAVLVAISKTNGSRKEGQQWIHTTVLACANNEDCLPELCDDAGEPTGFGKRKRRSDPTNSSRREIEFDNKVPFQIIFPGGTEAVGVGDGCTSWIIGVSVLLSTTATSCILLAVTCHWYSQKRRN